MATGKRTPQRMCVGCRQMKDKNDLIRVIHTQDGEFCIDRSGRKNGRGAYVCRTAECIELAVKNRGLERSLKAKIPRETAEALIKEMSALVE